MAKCSMEAFSFFSAIFYMSLLKIVGQVLPQSRVDKGWKLPGPHMLSLLILLTTVIYDNNPVICDNNI